MRCAADACEKGVHCRGFCNAHYQRALKNGLERIQPRPASERMWARVEKTDTCWNWTGHLNNHGYGRIFDGQTMAYTHRISYELLVGPIPEGLELDHLCRNTVCVNPAHLEPVTHRENTLRGISPAALNASKTHCKRGHEFTPEDTYIRRSGQRTCAVCVRQVQRDKYAARQAVAS